MSSTVVHVKNISHDTSEKEVRDFFSFCGKITSLSVTPASEAANSPQSATVTFEKETAAKTALLLDSTQLGASQVSVSSAANLSDLGASTASHDETHDSSDISQEDKPRSRIVAEYLAHGYTISDNAIQRAITLDNKHGVSTRFTNALTTFDAKYKASDKAKGLDASYGITDKASQGWRGMTSYFEKAMGTPTGQKLAAFYTQQGKQVGDIHAEARRLADLKGGKTGGSKEENEKNMKDAGAGKTTCTCGGNDSACPCESGKCACSGCGKSSASAGGSKQENEKTMQQIPGTNKTTCGCGGDTGVCPCGEGQCACSGCPKSGLAGEKSATGPAADVAATSGVQPLGEKS